MSDETALLTAIAAHPGEDPDHAANGADSWFMGGDGRIESTCAGRGA